MDVEDIKNRLERVYLSIGERSDKDVEKYIKREETVTGDKKIMKITWGSEDAKDKSRVLNQIYSIISNLAKLKDHLKRLLVSKGGDGQLIEDEVKKSEHLKLILDLDNKDKHGQLLTIHHSGRDPYLDEVGRIFSIKGTDKDNKGSSTFSIGPDGQFKTDCKLAIVLGAKIKDRNGTLICDSNELVDKSIEKWEEVIKKYNLNK